jgi:hypothetical protein
MRSCRGSTGTVVVVDDVVTDVVEMREVVDVEASVPVQAVPRRTRNREAKRIRRTTGD